MKACILISALGMSMLFTSFCSAQVSTFPKPPPLAPPSDQNSSQNTNPTNTSESSTQNTSDNSKNADSSPSPETTSANVPKTLTVTAATLTSMEALDDKNPLEVGDTISFRVIEDRDDAVTRVVTDTGEVDFPYVGRLKVQGKTCHQVAVELKRLLEVDYYKRATVIVGLDLIIGQEKVKPHDLVWVIGEVREEGPQQLSKLQPMTVSQVILRAGGFGQYADDKKVRLIHRANLASIPTSNELPDLNNSSDAQIIDVKAIFEGKSTQDPIVKPNDYIFVPKVFVHF